VIIDLVPNHCSDRHPWFQAALRAGPGSPERQRFHFRPGQGANGELPPNNWQSIFRGSAWTRLPDGDWYLHLFAPEQPDFNWEHPDVRAEFADVLRFWLDRGVDGIRIDVAHGMVKAEGLPDLVTAETSEAVGLLEGAAQPFFDQDGVHEIYREWRSILDGYQPERIAVAEAWVPNVDRMARYVAPDELHQAFNFEFLSTPWSGPDYRRVIDHSLAAMSSVGAPATWVLSNHDVMRHASRLATGVGGAAGGVHTDGAELTADEAATGLRRARAAALIMLALPGSVYVYQGEELGLPEVLDLPAEARQDPIFGRTKGAELGRDGCRVPLPWDGISAPYSFGPEGSTPWLPQPDLWAQLSVGSQENDPASTLTLYRAALALRRDLGALGDGELRWLPSPSADVLIFERAAQGSDERALICVANLGAETVSVADLLPPVTPVLASGPVPTSGVVPPDTAVWFTAGAGPTGWTIT
jgi:alpha-glucosidase